MGRPTASLLIASLLVSAPAMAQNILYDNGLWNHGGANGAPDFNDRLAFVTTTDIEEVLESGQGCGRDIVIMTARSPDVFVTPRLEVPREGSSSS